MGYHSVNQNPKKSVSVLLVHHIATDWMCESVTPPTPVLMVWCVWGEVAVTVGCTIKAVASFFLSLICFCPPFYVPPSCTWNLFIGLRGRSRAAHIHIHPDKEKIRLHSASFLSTELERQDKGRERRRSERTLLVVSASEGWKGRACREKKEGGERLRSLCFS